jgi:hypothetical protein
LSSRDWTTSGQRADNDWTTTEEDPSKHLTYSKLYATLAFSHILLICKRLAIIDVETAFLTMFDLGTHFTF